jgi:prepilin-type N-terminal cleavage/methylation domain-containing protein
MNNWQKKQGFTLVELMIAISLLGMIVASFVGIFFANIKSEQKAQNLSKIKQSGDYAVSVIRRMIRNAEDIDCSSTPNQVEVTNPDGGQTVFACDGCSNMIASNSACLVSSTMEQSNCSFVCNTAEKPNTVQIDFTLSNGQTDALLRAEQDFSALVSLRNY